ncbi:MAG: Thioredoxin [Candidatus Woesebacteria bacterium GW2011_GWB1_38_5b]|uniref:Thioredoxin n=1 Tax=Candidatus Woesebacteria bacterium GW2011_GWB1_38_5b TaxID=1618569 RepID=A0A0G0K2Q8_9BACT|nr:MAG: Thioredoxin [Candidatus Woesebacteria bacterium GW2011_GWB1_38_5b]OGH48316.1 MAG: thioredoxin [Candidatus Levybacteria bacterium RIFCSPLOWO2_01_FULL_39_10]
MADITLTDQNFDAEVLKSESPVLVDFWAAWCAPCKIVDPIVEELAGEYGTKLKVGKLNVDENPASAGNYSVMSIPTIMLFKGGKPMKSVVGAQAKENFKKAIDEVLAS